VTLLEEPQAALYAWIGADGDRWRSMVKAGDVILVVDVGGGTTDFSAIAVSIAAARSSSPGSPSETTFSSAATNMDLALAHVVRAKLEAQGKEIDRWQMVALTHASRVAKERLLTDAKLASAPIVIASRGSKLLGGGLAHRAHARRSDRDPRRGLLPAHRRERPPDRRARGALTQLGLPYAADAGITRHLAAFLARQADATSKLEGFPASKTTGKLLRPTALLFNGGVMKGNALRDRVVGALDSWLEADGAPKVRVLEGAISISRSLAAPRRTRWPVTAKGSAFERNGARRTTSASRAPLLRCRGRSADHRDVPRALRNGGRDRGEAPAERARRRRRREGPFPLLRSSVRRADVAGTELERWKGDELEELAPIEVTLPAKGRAEGDVVPVRLHAAVTEVGTLLLEAVPTTPLQPDERWKIELNVRPASD